MGKLTLKMILEHKRFDSEFCSRQSIVGEHVLQEASSGTFTVLDASCKWNNTSSHGSVFWAHGTASLM